MFWCVGLWVWVWMSVCVGVGVDGFFHVRPPPLLSLGGGREGGVEEVEGGVARQG